MKTPIASCALASKRLQEVAIADPSVGTFHCAGFSKLSNEMPHYAVIASIASRPSEALSLALLEDGRAVIHTDAFEAHLKDEVLWIEGIRDPVWEVFASAACIPGSSCRALRSECLDAAHASCAYIHESMNNSSRKCDRCNGLWQRVTYPPI